MTTTTTMHSQRFLLFTSILFGCLCMAAVSNPDEKTSGFVTQTVYGFLDFTTTIGKTVMIFSPQSAPSLDFKPVTVKPVEAIQTKPYSDQSKSTEIAPTKSSASESSNKKSTTQDTAVARKEYLNQPDYDLLSRQPETFAEESYHVIDLATRRKPNTRKSNAAKDPHPIGLVTTLSGKVARDGTTTIHETSVIGTYISGKYAQVLQSNSHVLNNSHHPLSPTSTARVLRTEAPSLQTAKHFGGQIGRFKNRAPVDEHKVVTHTAETTTQSNSRKHNSSGGKHKTKGRQKNKTNKVLRSSHRESDNGTPSSASHESKRYSYRQRPQTAVSPSTTSPISFSTSSFIKPRPVGRWQYKSTLKPRVYIRKATDLLSSTAATTNGFATINDIEPNTVNTGLVDVISASPNIRVDKIFNNIVNDNQTSATTLYPVETINIDIVTPSDFQDVYYEVATIKTPYVFQMAGVKKTRYITVTSTTEKLFDTEYADKSTIKGPLIENILAPTTPINQLLQASSITTFPACTLTDATETPALEEFIDTYTQSQLKLKTQVFPIVGQNQSTNYITLLQTYGVTTVITATKTTPVCLGNNFNEFNSKLDESGSELHLDLEFGDIANHEPDTINTTSHIESSNISIAPNEVSSKKTDDQPSSFYPPLSPEQLQQLAYLKLFQQPQLSTQPQEIAIDKSTPLPQPIPSLNPFVLPQQQFTIITSPIVRPTVLTQTLSRILKLTFGAKTAHTTIYSTNVVSTDVSTFVTTSIPVQQTPAYPNFFPPAFAPYPFLG